MTPCPPCVDSKRPRVYVQNVPMCTGTTRTCFNTCARGAGIHGDVLNVHTEAFLKPHTGFFPRFFNVPQHTNTHTQTHTHTKHTPRPPTTPRPQQPHTTQHTPHNITRRQRKKTEKERQRKRDRERETEKERQDKTREDDTRQEDKRR